MTLSYFGKASYGARGGQRLAEVPVLVEGWYFLFLLVCVGVHECVCKIVSVHECGDV